MAAQAEVIALDTNLLVYAHRASVPEHLAARRAIERACSDPHGCGLALPSLAEFWSVVTHPSMPGRPSAVGEAAAFIQNLVADGGLAVWGPGIGFAERLAQLAIDLNVRGLRIFDLQIALMAFDQGAHEIWTHDAHFAAIPGLRVVDPLS